MDERTRTPKVADEREMLLAWLEYHRATLQLKCTGLSHDQLRFRAVEPSTMSLLGLVRHMAEVERSWFRRLVAGEDAPPRYYDADNPDGDFDDVDGADVDEGFAAWREEMDHARRITDENPSFDATFAHPRYGAISMRWVIVHMLEEYARHNGHADLLRERIDGVKGD